MVSSNRPVALHLLEAEKAQVPFSLATFLRNSPDFRRDLIYRLIVLAASLVFRSPLMLIAGLIILIPLAIKIRRVSDLVTRGSFYPAVVLAVEPFLIAYAGELSKASLEPQPVIVIHQADHLKCAQEYESGDRIGVVGRPVGGDHRRFDHLDARVVCSVCEDNFVEYQGLSKIPDWQWEDLDEALLDIGQPFAPGVYSVSLPDRVGAR